jgi:hypothetical protein
MVGAKDGAMCDDDGLRRGGASEERKSSSDGRLLCARAGDGDGVAGATDDGGEAVD